MMEREKDYRLNCGIIGTPLNHKSRAEECMVKIQPGRVKGLWSKLYYAFASQCCLGIGPHLMVQKKNSLIKKKNNITNK